MRCEDVWSRCHCNSKCIVAITRRRTRSSSRAETSVSEEMFDFGLLFDGGWSHSPDSMLQGNGIGNEFPALQKR